MNSTKQQSHRFRLFVAAITMLGGVAFSAAAHEPDRQHKPHKPHKPARAELGTSAAVDPQGRLWVAAKETDGGAQYVVLQMSSDLGKTWSPPRRIQRTPEPVSAEGENRPKLAFGPAGELYVTYTKPLSKPYTGEIRFVRSLDGGQTFSDPVTVHANRDLITHRFESLIVDGAGRVVVSWIDKRDLHATEARKRKYRGAAVYYAVSADRGASFEGDYKLADHSCECCRIALALDPKGRPVAMWRHVFEPNARDHALALLAPDGRPAQPARVSFDDWRVDACPHQGPGLAYAPDGTRHQVWFNVKEGEGGVFHARADAAGFLEQPQRLGNEQAAHADVAVRGQDVVLAWKQFDGSWTTVFGRHSRDGGKTWSESVLASTKGASDQPRLVVTQAGVVLVWRTQQDGIVVADVAGGRQ